MEAFAIIQMREVGGLDRMMAGGGGEDRLILEVFGK